MHLPEQLQHFSHPTLVVAGDHISARFLLLGGDSVEELDGVAVPRDPPQDSEATQSSPPSELADKARLTHLAKLIAEQLKRLVHAHDIMSVNILMPADIERMVAAELSPEVSQKIGKVLHLDVLREDPLKMVERLLEKK